MTNVAYTHLNTPNNNILYDSKVGGFRLAGRRGPLALIRTGRFGLPSGRFFRVGVTIIRDLMSRAVPAIIADDIPGELKARAIEAVEASAAYRHICQHARRSDGVERLAFAFGEQERT